MTVSLVWQARGRDDTSHESRKYQIEPVDETETWDRVKTPNEIDIVLFRRHRSVARTERRQCGFGLGPRRREYVHGRSCGRSRAFMSAPPSTV